MYKGRSRFVKMPGYSMLPDGKGEWISESELVFYSEKFGVNIEVPAGSVNNLASIPWTFRRIFAVNGPHRPAAALHDYLFETHGLGKYMLEECNDIFYEAMTSWKCDYFDALGAATKHRARQAGRAELFEGLQEPLVSKKIAWLMKKGVDIGGFIYWNKKR